MTGCGKYVLALGNRSANGTKLTCGVTVVDTGGEKLREILGNVAERRLEVVSASTSKRAFVDGISVVDTVGINGLGSSPVVNVTVEAPVACLGVSEYDVVEHNTAAANLGVTVNVDTVNGLGYDGVGLRLRAKILTVYVVVESDGITVGIKLNTDNNVNPTGEGRFLGNSDLLERRLVQADDLNVGLAGFFIFSSGVNGEDVFLNSPFR